MAEMVVSVYDRLMSDYVLKLYRRTPPALASKVVKRFQVRAADTPAAIAEAKVLYATESQDAEFAMLFVSQGDLVWISEGTRANGGECAPDVISTVRVKR